MGFRLSRPLMSVSLPLPFPLEDPDEELDVRLGSFGPPFLLILSWALIRGCLTILSSLSLFEGGVFCLVSDSFPLPVGGNFSPSLIAPEDGGDLSLGASTDLLLGP